MHLIRSVPLSRAEADALADALAEAEEPAALSVSMVEIDERMQTWQVEAHYAAPPSPMALEGLGLEKGRVNVEPLPDVDWVARSLAALPPVEAGRFVVHGRHDRDRVRPGGTPIEIDAATAFGTGHHATTRSCLLAIDRLLKGRRLRRVLDIGCGTGILAIAVARAAHCPVVGTDIDPEAVRVGRANARLNGVGMLVCAEVAAGGRLPEGRYDLVLANILAGPLVAMAARLSRTVAPAGELVLSGLLRGQERAVLGAYLPRGLVLAGRIRIGEWSTLVVRRPEGRLKKGAPGTGRECRARRHQSGRRGLVRTSGCLRPKPCAGSRSA